MTDNLNVLSIEKELNTLQGYEKVLVLSDLHIPFHNEDKILEVIKRHKDEVNLIVFAGDILDCFSISSFPKENQIPFYEELHEGSKFLRKIDRMTPNIKKVIFLGNHEFRYQRYLAKELSELTSLLSNSVLDYLESGFSYRNYKNVKTLVPPIGDNFEVVNTWFYQYEDIIFAHPTNFSKIPMKTVVNTYDYFKNNGYNFSALCVGHTHKLGTIMYGSTLLVENGCLCQDMDYVSRGNINYTPITLGYSLFTLKDGRVLHDKSGSRLI